MVTNGRRWNGTLSEKKKRKEKKKLSAHSPYAVGTTHGVISWYCGRDKRKRIVYTHERWTIISTIVKLADDALLRRKTRGQRIARIAFPAFPLIFYAYDRFPVNESFASFRIFNQRNGLPLPLWIWIFLFSDTRKERIKYLTWARANRENRVCDLERTNVVIS